MWFNQALPRRPAAQSGDFAARFKKWLLIGCFALGGVTFSSAAPENGGGVQSGTNTATRPFLAIWRDFDGKTYAPSLRVAIWNDGRVLFAKEAPKWGTNLFLGRLKPGELTALKDRVRATGILDLGRTSYLVPDDAVYCLLVDLGDKRQLLYWNEDELRYYWNEDTSVPGTVIAGDFKRCWVKVNRLALSAAPASSSKTEEGFKGAPKSWCQAFPPAGGMKPPNP